MMPKEEIYQNFESEFKIEEDKEMDNAYEEKENILSTQA